MRSQSFVPAAYRYSAIDSHASSYGDGYTSSRVPEAIDSVFTSLGERWRKLVSQLDAAANTQNMKKPIEYTSTRSSASRLSLNGIPRC